VTSDEPEGLRLAFSVCYSERSEESPQFVGRVPDWKTTIGILRCYENGGSFCWKYRSYLQRAIFMHSGEPKDHEVFAQNDMLTPVAW